MLDTKLKNNLLVIEDADEYCNFIYMLDYYLNQCYSLDYKKELDFTDWEDMCVMTLSCFNLYFVAASYPELKKQSMALTRDTSIFSRYVNDNMYGSGALDMFRRHPIKDYKLTMEIFKDGLKQATKGLLIFRDIYNPSEDEIEFYSAIVVCILSEVSLKFTNTCLFKNIKKPTGVFRYAKLLWLKTRHNHYLHYLTGNKVR